MVACAVRNCSNRSTKKKEHEKKTRISFHRLPQDPKMYTAWVNALRLRRENWNPTKSSVVCSDHFTYDCFDSSDFQRRLVRHAVPTIFPEIDPGKKKTTSRGIRNPLQITKKPCTINVQVPTFVIIDTANLLLNKAATSFDNHFKEKESVSQLISRATSVSPKHQLRSPTKVNKNIENYYIKKIRLLQQEVRSQMKRISSLKSILNGLRKKRSIKATITPKTNSTLNSCV